MSDRIACAVIDTHALFWAATGQDKRLGKRARRLIQRADEGALVLYVSAISLLELGDMSRQRRNVPGVPLATWAQQLTNAPGYAVADMTTAVALRAAGITGAMDWGNRIIAATALELDCPVISRDPEMAGVRGLEVIWDG